LGIGGQFPCSELPRMVLDVGCKRLKKKTPRISDHGQCPVAKARPSCWLLLLARFATSPQLGPGPGLAQGGSTRPPGVLVGPGPGPGPVPPPVRKCKCHQMPSPITKRQKSTCDSAGSSVVVVGCWILIALLLAHTPRTPRGWGGGGGAAVSCQYLPCSFVLTLRA
jgi:hypothetical protein